MKENQAKSAKIEGYEEKREREKEKHVSKCDDFWYFPYCSLIIIISPLNWNLHIATTHLSLLCSNSELEWKYEQCCFSCFPVSGKMSLHLIKYSEILNMRYSKWNYPVIPLPISSDYCHRIYAVSSSFIRDTIKFAEYVDFKSSREFN